MNFSNVTTGSGVLYQGRQYGVGWLDFNGDGLPDIWTSQHNSHALVPNAKDVSLFINQGNGTFANATSGLVQYVQKDFHGFAAADFNNDGRTDVAQVSGSVGKGGVTLFEQHEGRALDVSTSVGLQPAFNTAVGRGIATLDYNHDGLLDLVMGSDQISTSGNPGQPAQMIRQTAVGNWVSARAETGTPANFSGIGPVLADLDGDRPLEIIWTHYGAIPKVYDTSTLPFTAATAKWFGGVDISNQFDDIAVADFNNDGRPDIYLSRSPIVDEVNASGNTIDAYLFKGGANKGFSFVAGNQVTFTFSRQDGTMHYDQIRVGAGCLKPLAVDTHNPVFTLYSDNPAHRGVCNAAGTIIRIGWDAAHNEWDVSNKGEPRVSRGFLIEGNAPADIMSTNNFQTQPGTPQLLINTGTRFIDGSIEAGVVNLAPNGNKVAVGDFDNDGDVDIYVDQSGPGTNRGNVFLVNDGAAHFTSQGDTAGASLAGVGGPIAVADYDRDGYLDLLVSNGGGEPPFTPTLLDGPLQLFHNDDSSNNWLEVELHGTQSNADAIGARVTINVGGQIQYRWDTNGQHITAQDDPDVLHFGLGAATDADVVTIDWPSGQHSVFTDVAANQVFEVTEPVSPMSDAVLQ